MADKDQFTFDDDDDFPETDLSATFAEGEHSAEGPVQDMSAAKVKGGGNPRTRILLIVLLLVVAGAAGVYYFMGLGGTTPTVPVPAQTTTKSVALPPQPAQAPAPQTPAEPVVTPVTVAVPPPPPSADAEPSATETAVPPQVMAQSQPGHAPPAVEQPVAGQTQTQSTEPQAAQATVPEPQPATELQTPSPASQPVADAATSAAEPVRTSTPASAARPVAGSGYTLDVGSFLLESNRDELVAKIKKLGYEPLVTPIDATLNMTRLRLGTFGRDEVENALDFARSIEPGSYSAPAGDRYVIYAGTFLKSESVDKLTRRFLEEGIKVHPEPVQVVRTLSRIRFGNFATQEEAAAVAREVGKAGLRANAVKSR